MVQPIPRPSNSRENVDRPFTPPLAATDEERISYALEFVATALARIDHNLEVLTQAFLEAPRR